MIRLLIKHFRDTRSNILDLVPFNEILCCLVNGELLKAKFLLFLSLFEVLSSRKSQLCDLSAIQSNNSGGHFVFCSMTRAQAQNAWDGGLHIKCHNKNRKKPQERSRNLNSAPSARVKRPLDGLLFEMGFSLRFFCKLKRWAAFKMNAASIEIDDCKTIWKSYFIAVLHCPVQYIFISSSFVLFYKTFFIRRLREKFA